MPVLSVSGSPDAQFWPRTLNLDFYPLIPWLLPDSRPMSICHACSDDVRRCGQAPGWIQPDSRARRCLRSEAQSLNLLSLFWAQARLKGLPGHPWVCDGEAGLRATASSLRPPELLAGLCVFKLQVPQPSQEMWHLWQGDVVQVTLADQSADSKPPDSGIAKASGAARLVSPRPTCGL